MSKVERRLRDGHEGLFKGCGRAMQMTDWLGPTGVIQIGEDVRAAGFNRAAGPRRKRQNNQDT